MLKKMSLSVLLLGALALVLLVLGWVTFGMQRLPKDDELIRSFSEHKNAYEKIVTMAQEDRDLEFITAEEAAHKFDSSPDGPGVIEKEVSQQRLDGYRRLLREIGITDIVAIWTPRRQVAFYLYSDGLATKGICYWDKEPREEATETVFTSLDDLKKLPQQDGHVRNGVYLKPITGRWCVFLYWKD